MAHPGGRPRLIKSPEQLLEHFEDYKQWAHDNPWYKVEAIKSGDMAGELVHIPIERPMTEWGFAVYLGTSRQCLQGYAKREEFIGTYARIKDEMSAMRVEGGVTQLYNPNLVARIDGISEKSEIEHTGLPEPPKYLHVILDRGKPDAAD